jgi:hypothetical protein
MQELGIITSLDFRVAINTYKDIALSTTYLWLDRLGFYPLESKKGVYVDGYEREDVIAYR